MLGFVVLAPQEQIKAEVFGTRVSTQSALERIRQRAAAYSGVKDSWCEQVMEPFLEKIQLYLLSWEDVLDTIERLDQRAASGFRVFYEKCLKFNRPRGQRAVT